MDDGREARLMKAAPLRLSNQPTSARGRAIMGENGCGERASLERMLRAHGSSNLLCYFHGRYQTWRVANLCNPLRPMNLPSPFCTLVPAPSRSNPIFLPATLAAGIRRPNVSTIAARDFAN
jgi:hypothetical protein